MSNSSVSINIDPVVENRPMKTGKSKKSWLGEYHWVSLPIDENTQPNYIEDAVNWCIEYFGKSGNRWMHKQHVFYFKDEKDLGIFILKWS